MINITRESNTPSSLDTQEIRNYIKACADYKDDPDNNPKPNKPTGTTYRNSDVLEAFDRCFFSKCYLTEQKYPNSWVMDIEHFIPQNEDSSLVYEWSNLYPAEHKANMAKPRRNPEGGYLDPCNNQDDVETEIIYTITDFGAKPNFDPSDPQNQKAVNTCNLLNRIHNGYNVETEKNTAGLRLGIQQRSRKLLEKIAYWWALDRNTQEEVQLRREIKQLLSRKSSFTMLIRSIPAVIQLNRKNPDLHFFD